MRVLMLESHAGVANAAITRMTEAGHTIVRCDTADRRSPCRGLAAGGECPLDEHVDVAVLVQEIGTCHVEHGAVCAARSRVPVVEVDGAGIAQRLPITSWTAVAGPGLLDECERAAHDGHAHAQAVEDRLVVLGVVTPARARPAGRHGRDRGQAWREPAANDDRAYRFGARSTDRDRAGGDPGAPRLRPTTSRHRRRRTVGVRQHAGEGTSASTEPPQFRL